MTVHAFRLEAIVWLLASIYLLVHDQRIAACVVFLCAIVKGFAYSVRRQ